MENVFVFGVFTGFFLNPGTYKEGHPPPRGFLDFFSKRANITT